MNTQDRAMTSEELLASFAQAAPEGQTLETEYKLCPEFESATLRVKKAEITAPKLSAKGEQSRYWAQLRITYVVDEEEAREAMMRDEATINHSVMITCLPSGQFDWNNNQRLGRFLLSHGVDVKSGNPITWAEDLVGRSVKGKIIHAPAMDKNPDTGVYDLARVDDEGEQVYNAEVSAVSRFD